MTATAGYTPATSTTARPADKGANTGVEAAVRRRVIDGIVAVLGCRRQEARERIAAWEAGGIALDDLEAYLRATYRRDPIGVTAVRNVGNRKGAADAISC